MNILQKATRGAPKQVFLHSHRVTKENVSEFLESLNKEQTVSLKMIRVRRAEMLKLFQLMEQRMPQTQFRMTN
jgi:hypothetical protein